MITKPHLVIDARLYGPKHTGIGRYTQNLLCQLITLPNFSKFNVTLIVYPDTLPLIRQDLGNHCNYVTTNIRHYSISEQILLPLKIYSLHPDLVHFTHFNKPLFYLGPSIITIHDLIKHFSKGKDTTTKNQFFYWFKYLGYLAVTNINIKHNQLIVPSNFWRNYIITNFHLDPQKITTTYEAVDPKFLKLEKTISTVNIPQKYFLYTGNLYPHKNVTIILRILKQFPDFKLKIICSRSIFTSRIIVMAKKYQVDSQVEFLGYVPDKKFLNLYQHAFCLIHPALMEGFSLTGLEAMALHCPVVSSNASCMPEIYRQNVLYFDPTKPDDLAAQVKKIQEHPSLRLKLINQGLKLIKLYSWKKTASQTLTLYQQLINETA